MLEKEQAAEPGPHDPKAGQELQAKIEDLQKTLHDMPKGYPQKYMYKYPKIDALRCQTHVDSQEYKGSVEKGGTNSTFVTLAMAPTPRL